MLRFITVLLITNSHMDALYPVPELAAGGGLGNALFFGLSGYGLAISQSLTWRFPAWMGRRLARVYPSTLIVTLATVILVRPDWVGSTAEAFKTIVYPTPFWFVAALLGYYVLLYPVLRTRSSSVAVAAAAVAVIPYAFLYLTTVDLSAWSIEDRSQYVLYFFYWMTMLLGVAMGLSRKRRHTAGPLWTLALVLLLGAYGGVKFGLGPVLGWEWQFLVHALTLPILVSALAIGESGGWLARPLRTSAGLGIAFVAGLTLEIYLVQYRVYSIPQIAALTFPLNVVVFAVGTLVVAWVVHRLAVLVRHAFSVHEGGMGY